MSEFQIQRGKHKIIIKFAQSSPQSVEDILVKILSRNNV